MKNQPINTVFAENTSNVTKPTDTTFGVGIPFGSFGTSDTVNGFIKDICQATQFSQLASGLYSDTQVYPTRSLVKCLFITAEGKLSAKWFMKLSDTVAGIKPILTQSTTINDVMVFQSDSNLNTLFWQPLDIGTGGGVTEADKSDTLISSQGYNFILTTLANGKKVVDLFAQLTQEEGPEISISMPFPLLDKNYSISVGETANNSFIGCNPILDSNLSLRQVNVSLTAGTGNKYWIHVKGIVDLRDVPLSPLLNSVNLANRQLDIDFDKVDTDVNVTTDIMVKKSITGDWEVLQAGVTSPFTKTFTAVELPDNSVWELSVRNIKNGEFAESEIVQVVAFTTIDVTFETGIGYVNNIALASKFPLVNFIFEYYTKQFIGSPYTLEDIFSSNLYVVSGANRVYPSTSSKVFGNAGLRYIKIVPAYTNGKAKSIGLDFETQFANGLVFAPTLSYVASTKTLNWDNPSGDMFKGFKLYKNGLLFQDNLTALTYTDSSMVSGDKYYVVGYNGLMNATSNEVTINLVITNLDTEGIYNSIALAVPIEVGDKVTLSMPTGEWFLRNDEVFIDANISYNLLNESGGIVKQIGSLYLATEMNCTKCPMDLSPFTANTRITHFKADVTNSPTYCNAINRLIITSTK